MTGVRVLSQAEVVGLISMAEAIRVVEDAFREDALGRTQNHPVVREPVPGSDAVFGVKSGMLWAKGVLGLKAGGYWPGNAARGVHDNHQSTVLLFDAGTGTPLCLMGASALTAMRTGASGALATRLLARPGARRVVVLGAGVQAHAQLEGLRHVLPSAWVGVWSRKRERAASLVETVRTWGWSAAVLAGKLPDEVRRCDILVTATPSVQPLVNDDWISEGVHINAIGSDTRGKRELHEQTLRRARVVVDNLEQSRRLGEMQYLTDADVTRPLTLGAVLVGAEEGRQSPEQITVFDATGVTFQDLAVAEFVFRQAEKNGVGRVVEL